MVNTLIILFVEIVPLYIGITTILSFVSHRDKPLVERTKKCRDRKFLAVCIILLVLIPGELIYSTLTHEIPEGEYEMNAPYYISSYEEIDDGEEGYGSVYDNRGTAPVIIRIEYDQESYEDGADYIGEPRMRIKKYPRVYLLSIVLDCFDDEKFDVYEEMFDKGNWSFWVERDIERNGILYNLEVEIDEVTDETLNYTIEDRINGVSIWGILESCILLALDIIGIIGYFMAMNAYDNNDEKRIQCEQKR